MNRGVFSMGREYDVLDIARYIINKCNEKGIIISNLKLQKLLYFVQGYMLALTGNRCFPEKIEAWDCGPVCPNAYHEFKRYGAMNIPPIKEYLEVSFDSQDNISWDKVQYDPYMIDSDTRKIIDAIIDNFAHLSATRLVDITHNQLPWHETYYSHPSERNAVIDEQLIKKYFENLANG